jgi:hypothetical protein
VIGGHYNEHNDSVLCFTCKKAHDENKLRWSLNADSAFVNIGFLTGKMIARSLIFTKKVKHMRKLF